MNVSTDPTDPSASSSDSASLQFDKAELTEAPLAESVACANCNRLVTSTYYQIGTAFVCEACRAGVFRTLEMTGRFGRATVFGLAAAVVGAVIWYAIREATGYEIGLVAIGIGIFVGMAVRKGSMSLGGIKYQILAVLLTYLSITMANIPVIIETIRSQATSTSAEASSSEPRTLGGFFIAWGLIVLLALITPFLVGLSNILGILIIGFGLYQAWKINVRQELSIQGPFTVATSSPKVESTTDSGASG